MDLKQLIQHPELMNRETLYDLRSIIALYPYHQTARLLMLKNLYLLHDSSFDEELRRSAFYITDRTTLFEIVEAKHYHLRRHDRPADIAPANADADRTEQLIDNFLEQIPVDATEENRERRKPTAADAAVDYIAYLLLNEDENEMTDTASDGELSLIDRFLSNDGGKISLDDEKPVSYEHENVKLENDEEELVEDYYSENLAKIYIKKGNYLQAFEIIQRLNLNNPKKNAYFADQMRFLEKIILIKQ